ncbi:MAG: insulinase family protein [Bradyrhizobiaceae bacterium]|nr:insulinase family protein [Bradyrhizobiaceae bacterium]
MLNLTIHEYTLANGLRVVLCPKPGAPVVSVNVTYHVGSINEQVGKTGLAHLFEHLMFDNTTTGIDKQYDKYCTRAGGSNNAYTTYDHTSYYINLPSHQLELGLWLEAQRMAGFAINEVALQTQRSVVLEEIKQNMENQPYMKWNPAMDAAAFKPGSSYSWNVYGSPADVAAVQMDDVRDFYNRFYHPKNAVLVVAGDVEIQHAKELIDRTFGQIAITEFPPKTLVVDNDFQRMGVHVVEPDDVPLPAVFLAYHLPPSTDDRMYDADLLSGFFGSGKRAVLYRELVATSRIASAAGCFLDKRMHGSMLVTYAYTQDPGTSADELAQAMHKALYESTVQQQDRDRLVNRIRASLASDNQRVGRIADNLAWAATFYKDPSRINRQMDLYSTRTVDSMRDLHGSAIKQEAAVRVDIVPRT